MNSHFVLFDEESDFGAMHQIYPLKEIKCRTMVYVIVGRICFGFFDEMFNVAFEDGEPS